MHRPQDDIPYERQMLNIIRGYRWLLDQNERLANYARKLERKVEQCKYEHARQGAANRSLSEHNIELRNENKELKRQIMALKSNAETTGLMEGTEDCYTADSDPLT